MQSDKGRELKHVRGNAEAFVRAFIPIGASKLCYILTGRNFAFSAEFKLNFQPFFSIGRGVFSFTRLQVVAPLQAKRHIITELLSKAFSHPVAEEK